MPECRNQQSVRQSNRQWAGSLDNFRAMRRVQRCLSARPQRGDDGVGTLECSLSCAHFLPRPPWSPLLWTAVALQVLFHSTHIICPCPPADTLQRAPSRAKQQTCCWGPVQLRLSGFPFCTEIVWCLSTTLTLSSQTSAPHQSLGCC